MIKTETELMIRLHDDELEVRLPCEIDHHSALEVRRRIDTAIGKYRPRCLIIDAAQVNFMDSSGLGLLMGRYAAMQRIGGTMILACPSAGVLRMIHLAGMERIFTIENKPRNKKQEEET